MPDTLDEELNNIARLVNQSESGTSVINPEMVARVRNTSKLLKKIVKGKDVKITCELNEPYVSMGSVSIVGNEISIENPSDFVRAAMCATNFEVYPKVDGTVQINLTFYGLARKVK